MLPYAMLGFGPVHTIPQLIAAAAVGTVLFIGLMVVLHRTPPRVRKYITIGLTFVAGLLVVLEFLLPTQITPEGPANGLTTFMQQLSEFMLNVSIWTFGLGIISLLIVHGRRIIAGRQGWHNSLAFFLAFLAMTVLGIAVNGGDLKLTAQTAHLAPLLRGYDVLFSALLINLDSTMFALLAFYIASAAYRAFRIRTLEASLLMVAALLVMLGMVSFGVLLTNWIPKESFFAGLRIENLYLWMLNWINMAGQRAVLIGVAIGGLAMAMRLWLSLERGSFFSQES